MLSDDERLISVRLYSGGPARFAEGGLVNAADEVAGAGRFGDEMVVHINRREFEELRQKWGEPHVNPDTGLPEFFNLKDLWKDVKDYAAPVGAGLAGAFLPGIGEAVGGMLPGEAGLLGSTGTQALATGLLGAGAGALINGGKGALYGGLGGVLGSYGGDLLQNGSSSALGSLLGGGADSLESDAAKSLLGGGSEGAIGNLLGGGGGNRLGGAALAAAVNLAGNAMDQGGDEDEKSKKAWKKAQQQNQQPLPVYVNPRKRNGYTGVPDYTTQGEAEYFDNNYAEGGPVGYVANETGDHGRSDKIEALLSPNEYVIDAETVSLLGNGSPEAGAAQLDQLRANIRKHKGSALAAGAISPDALPADQYI